MNNVQIALSVLMLIVAILQASMLVAYRSGTLTGAVIKRLEDIEQRLDKASEHSSRLASMVQGNIGRLDKMPEQLREIFMSRDSAIVMMDDRINQRRADDRRR